MQLNHNPTFLQSHTVQPEKSYIVHINFLFIGYPPGLLALLLTALCIRRHNYSYIHISSIGRCKVRRSTVNVNTVNSAILQGLSYFGKARGYVMISRCDMSTLESSQIVVNLLWETSQSHRKIIHSKSNLGRGKGDYPSAQKQINAKLMSCHAYHISKTKNKGAGRHTPVIIQSNLAQDYSCLGSRDRIRRGWIQSKEIILPS